ncbi:MAG: hybrid sensor histidine kinase/response regulator [Ignavibacteriales bacterium]|nr:hybrid sensor histidine kinase/response regulator [Ignavibacteriales bacterium]
MTDNEKKPVEKKDPVILVVDDTEDNLDLLEFALKRKPVEMIRANSGMECLNIARDRQPDVILLDIQMPEMDGFETLKRLRENPVTAKIPVIFLTAQRKEPESIERGLLMGVDEYLTKPIDTDELLVRTKTLVRIKRMEAELERTKADFMAMLVHDLRSPLAGIKDVIEFFRELEKTGGSLTADYFTLLAASQESAERMLQLINNLLDLSKFEAGKITLNKEPLPIRKIVDKAAKQMDFQFRQRNIALQLNVRDDLPIVTVDGGKIGQVLMNLLSNSLKFAGSGGKVTVSVEATEERFDNQMQRVLAVSVMDTGMGIPQEEIAGIFQRYKQASTAKRVRQKGTGLGLAICKLIVEAHGGTIGVTSEVGKSTTFRFTLPLT